MEVAGLTGTEQHERTAERTAAHRDGSRLPTWDTRMGRSSSLSQVTPHLAALPRPPHPQAARHGAAQGTREAIRAA